MSQLAAAPPSGADAPLLRLELRHSAAPPSWFDVTSEEYLIGSVPGCDLRLPGQNLPPVIAQILRRPDGIRIRKLAVAYPVWLNGQPIGTQAQLAHGDTLRVGSAELVVHLALPQQAVGNDIVPKAPKVAFVPTDRLHSANVPSLSQPLLSTPATSPASQDVWRQYQQEIAQFREEKARFEEQKRWLEQRQQEIEQKRRQLEEHERELEADRVLWYQRREQIEQECREQARRLAEEGSRHVEMEQALQQKSAQLDAERQALLSQQQQLQADTKRLHDLRRELEERERDAENQFRELSQRLQTFEPRWRELENRDAALRQREAELKRIAEAWIREKQTHEARWQERQQHLDMQESALKEREAQCAAAERLQAQYHADLERLDRRGAALDQREQELAERAAEIERRYEQLQRDAREMEEQARLLDGGQARLHEEAQKLARQKSEQEAMAAQLAERLATLEGQQAMLATLRTRLERMREELRQQAQQVAAERAKQEDLASQIQQRLEEANRIRHELENESKTREQERALFDQRSAALHAAVLQMRALQEKLEREDAELRERSQQLDQQAAEQAEQAALLKARAQQLLELQQRIEADRLSLREREAHLLQAEEARKALQEQLLRRSEELTTRSRELDDRAEGIVRKEAELARRREEIEAERQRDQQQIDALRQDIDARSAEIQRLNAALNQREEALRRQLERLKESGRTLAAERKALFEARRRWDAERQEAVDQLTQLRDQVERFRNETLREAQDLVRQMPDLELHSQAAIERLSQSREQLRGYLQELHSYSRQAQEDLQELRNQIQAEADRLRQQELALQRARSEHRLAVTAFRQQLIDWQGRVAELKQFFLHNESRLEQKQAAIEAAAREIDETSKQLSRQAETLQQQRREVAEQKSEVETHLNEMREWYRRKLRELTAGRSRPADDGSILELATANAVNDPATASSNPPVRDILTLTGEVDPADRKLGELLLRLGLADEAMLIPLWNEARRQRRSLRQVLLSSGAITLYQMALIEASNLDGLALGRFRVIDRLQVNPRETLYRVFDPQRSQVALLRHLSEAEMNDAVHAGEYRQRFTAAAAISHPNLAATWEVCDILGRPAVLQEWLAGLPSSEWPGFAAAPGVLFRLFGQTALGLQAAHQAGLYHGHLKNHHVMLTADGLIKVSGFGEPAWLVNETEPDDPLRADLAALGQLVVEWSLLTPSVKRGKPRAMPEAFIQMVRRLGTAAVVRFDAQGHPEYEPPVSEHERYSSIGALLDDLDQVGADLPPNLEAWDRLVKYASENATDPVPQRRTA